MASPQVSHTNVGQSAQLPLMPVLQARHAASPANPMTMHDALAFPFIATRIPFKALGKGDDLFVAITGPAKCSEFLTMTDYEFADCTVTVEDCKKASAKLHKRAGSGSESSVASFSVSEDIDMSDSESLDDLHREDEDVAFDASEPNAVMATATAAAIDQRNVPAPTGHLDLAQQALATGIPRSVLDALVNDKNAPKSLANEFSGYKSPDWYKKLPKDERRLFITSKTPKVPTSAPEPTVTTYHGCPANPRANRKNKTFRKKEGKIAKYRSGLAKAESDLARYLSCPALSSAAHRHSSLASEEKRRSRDPKKTRKHNAASSTISRTSALFTVSITIAAATLGLAAYL